MLWAEKHKTYGRLVYCLLGKCQIDEFLFKNKAKKRSVLIVCMYEQVYECLCMLYNWQLKGAVTKLRGYIV